MKYRIEKDKLGEKTIPLEAYYGIGTARSKEAFQITKHVLSRQMIKALAQTKKVSAKTNFQMGLISERIKEAICFSADEILNGRLHGQFITDILQDGYGYGMEINASEVICNRANEMLGSSKGVYDLVNLQEVNLFQDVKENVVLAGKLTTIKLVKKLIAENKKTINVLKNKITNQPKNGVTYLQLSSIIDVLERESKRINKSLDMLTVISVGQKVELDEHKKQIYLENYIKALNEESTEKYSLNKNEYSINDNFDCFLNISTNIKNLMINFSRCTNELKDLTKNNIIEFPHIQDVEVSKEELLFDFVKQISFYIVGNDLTVARAVEAGIMNENPYITIILASLYECINLVRRTIRTIKEKVFETMKLN